MKLLIVTDHRFYSFEDKIYDNYVFDYDFFGDYRSVFEEVTILARVKALDYLDSTLVTSSGPNVNFIGLPDLRGVSWLLRSRKIISELRDELLKFDAICYRIPSIASYRVAKLKTKAPSAFELIGDPKDSLFNISDSIFQKFYKSILGKIFERQTRYTVGCCSTGSYVSFNHLQKKFPLPKGSKHFTISSIRLLESQIVNILPELIYPIESVRIIHVGSFVPVKNQSILIEILEILINQGIDAHLQFVGDGPLRAHCEDLVRTKNLQNKVTFSGHITGADNIIRELDKNNLFILPSSSEGMPRSMIEAMARGLICFGSRKGGIPELLDEAFTFELDNIQLIANTIMEVIFDGDLIRSAQIKNIEKIKFFEQSKLKKQRELLLSELKSNIK